MEKTEIYPPAEPDSHGYSLVDMMSLNHPDYGYKRTKKEQRRYRANLKNIHGPEYAALLDRIFGDKKPEIPVRFGGCTNDKS